MTKLTHLLAAFALVLVGFAASAQIPLQQSTASQADKFGPFVDSTDGNTEKTALTIANTDIKCSKNGGAYASKNSGGGTHDANGWYTVTFDATDTNTAGRLTCFVHVSGALPVWRYYIVYPTANYAALFTTAPGAANGLLIAGSNAATTFTGAAASGATPATAGLTLVGGAASTTGGGVAAPGLSSTGGAGAASTNGAAAGITTVGGGTTTVAGASGFTITGTGNLSGLAATGAGTGNGALFTSGAGATGDGFRVVSAATNGNGYSSAGAGTGSGDLMTGGATGHGANGVGGSTSGSGFRAIASAGNSAGAVITGQGTGNGATITSGSGATGNGLQVVAASTNGNGLGTTATGSGVDIQATFLRPATAGRTLVVDAAGLADANMVKMGPTGTGTAQTARDIGASVLLSPGTGTGQLSITSGAVTVGTNNDKTGYTASTVGSGAITNASYAVGAAGTIRSNTAQAGASTSITLDASANATNSYYNNDLVDIVSGTGAGQTKFITGYVGATKVATVDSAWVTNPDNTSVFTIRGFSAIPGATAPTASQNAQAVWDEALASHTTSGSAGERLGRIPNVAAGGSGGLLISGSNSGTTTLAALTVTGTTTMSDGLVVARSTANSPAATFTGNGTGNGITVTSGSGATGTGLAISSSATNGTAVTATGAGTGNGATFTSGSGATGNGLAATAASTNGNGFVTTGTGTGAGERDVAGATGSGVAWVGGSTSGNALQTTITAPLGAVPEFGIKESGTMQAGSTSTTAVLRSATNFTSDSIPVGSTIEIIAGTGAGQSRGITAYVNSTDTATVDAWTTTPDNTSQYIIWSTAPGASGSAPSAATVAAAVWDEALSGHTTSGTSGERLGRIPNAVAGASGGLLIAGTNADFDVTANVSLAGGLTITQSTANTAALVVTGNGTGNGATFTSGSGATGNGLQATAASTNGNGIGLTATGSGTTMTLTPANVTQFGGTNGTFSAGRPEVNATHAAGTAWNSGAITASTFATDAITAAKVASDVGSEFAVAFVDQTLSGHTTGGTVGGGINSASSAGDPWNTALPGAYGAGTAGNILGNNLNAAITSRQASFTLPTNFSSLAITGGGAVTAGTVSDKTGYSLSQSFPTNFASLAITGGGAVTAGTVSDKTGYALSVTPPTAAQVASTQGLIIGTCSSGSTTTCVDAALTQANASQLQDHLICFPTAASGDDFCAMVSFNPASDTVTLVDATGASKAAPSTRASKGYVIYPATK